MEVAVDVLRSTVFRNMLLMLSSQYWCACLAPLTVPLHITLCYFVRYLTVLVRLELCLVGFAPPHSAPPISLLLLQLLLLVHGASTVRPPLPYYHARIGLEKWVLPCMLVALYPSALASCATCARLC